MKPPRWWALAVVLVLSACGIVVPDFEATNRRPLAEVPVQYRVWHGHVERCVDEARDFDGIRWFVADELLFDGRFVRGVFKMPNEITLLSTAVLRTSTVKVELIHYVRQELSHGPLYDRCA